MKIRLGFVSNSSSASFIIHKDNLTKNQINKIKNHGSFIERNKKLYGHLSDHSYWHIEDEGDYIFGSTSMDNFDMHHYLIDIVKVNPDHIEWRY